MAGADPKLRPAGCQLGSGLTSMDIDRLRSETPGVEHRVHLNNAGAGLMPKPVLDTVKEHLDLEAHIGGYEAKAQENDRIEAVYGSVARLIGAETNEIALVENATVAWQYAFYSQDLQEGDRILTAESEYAANYIAYLQMQTRTGCVIDVIPSDESGATDVRALRSMIDDRVKLIAVTWIPTNGGLVNRAAQIGAVAREQGIPYLLDACQAVGQMPVDVDELGCDYLSATGRKFLRGPRGTGFLYVRSERLKQLEPVMLDLFGAQWTGPDSYEMRPDARRFETWESALALHLGLGRAADYALDIGLEQIRSRAWMLARHLREALGGISGISVRDIGAEQCAIVTFDHERIESSAIAAGLREADVNVSVSKPSSTLLDARSRGLPELVRASPHYYNTEEDLDAFLRQLRVLVD